MVVVKYILTVVLAYLLGSFSMSIFLSRKIGGDVRTKGSKNAGATNMARVYGMGFGVLTLAGDMLKAGIAMWIGNLLLGDWGIFAGGIASLIGHCFPIFHSFKGGKGVSVGAALGLALDWRVFVTIILVFLIVALLSKKVSLGSICASVSIFIAALAFGMPLPKVLLAFFGMIIVVARHKENIVRLIHGTEPDFRAGSMKKKDAEK
ncbi:MAG: glycerol-3-phosphate 1-O-acyltransferase PlsY [Candidatus Limivicinus sp.]|jgi:glycerol-3-phosphate acyltransferase PlsY